MRLIVAITGASGAIYGIRLLEALREVPDAEVHLVVSNGGKLNISLETDWALKDVEALAHEVHSDQNLAATIASGSFRTGGKSRASPMHGSQRRYSAALTTRVQTT